MSVGRGVAVLGDANPGDERFHRHKPDPDPDLGPGPGESWSVDLHVVFAFGGSYRI